jgi:hypothetical protein
VRLTLENVGRRPLEVLSHVAAGEIHLDWFTIHLDDRRIVLLDSRNRSIPVRARLAPGESLAHDVDLAAWAMRGPNGRAPLAPGDHEARGSYEVPADETAWTGRLEAGPVPLRVPDPSGA